MAIIFPEVGIYLLKEAVMVPGPAPQSRSFREGFDEAFEIR